MSDRHKGNVSEQLQSLGPCKLNENPSSFQWPWSAESRQSTRRCCAILSWSWQHLLSNCTNLVEPTGTFLWNASSTLEDIQTDLRCGSKVKCNKIMGTSGGRLKPNMPSILTASQVARQHRSHPSCNYTPGHQEFFWKVQPPMAVKAATAGGLTD